MSARNILALGALGLLFGLVIANISGLRGLVVKYGEKNTYSLQLDRVEEKAKQVAMDANEVRQMKEQIETLVKRVEQGEQNVTAMRDNVQHAYQSLFQSLGYVILTRNLFPPPDSIMKEMERHINLLGEFAYPNPQERAATIQKMTESAKVAQPQVQEPPQAPPDPQSK